MTFVAGGDERLPGDYLYGDHREPYREAGLWGIMRVHARGGRADIQPLSTDGDSGASQWAAPFGIGVAIVAVGAGALWVRKRRRNA